MKRWLPNKVSHAANQRSISALLKAQIPFWQLTSWLNPTVSKEDSLEKLLNDLSKEVRKSIADQSCLLKQMYCVVGYQIVNMKMVHASEEHLEKHYADLKGKPFFPGLVKYMASGPVVALVFQGKSAVGQSMAKSTNNKFHLQERTLSSKDEFSWVLLTHWLPLLVQFEVTCE